jgi:hypothetical protein
MKTDHQTTGSNFTADGSMMTAARQVADQCDNCCTVSSLLVADA